MGAGKRGMVLDFSYSQYLLVNILFVLLESEY